MNKILQILSNPIAIISIFGLIIFLRFYNLSADPPFLQDGDFMIDEGGWVHNARNQLLFDNWTKTDHDFPYFAAPGYVHLVLLAFKIGGLSLISARGISAMAGVLTVLVLFLFVKRESSKKEAMLTVIFLGLNYFHVLYSRVALVESLLTLTLILTIYLWRLGKTKTLFSFLAGLVFATLFVIKLSAFYFLPIFILLLLFEMLRKEFRWTHFLLFGIGGLCLSIPYLLYFIVPNWNVYLLYNFQQASISLNLKFIPNFFVFNQSLTFSPVLLILTASVMVDLIINLLREGKSVIEKLTYPAIVSLSILIGNSFFLALSSIQPPRRYLPFFISMALIASNFIASDKFFKIETLLEKPIKLFNNFILSGIVLFPLFIFLGWLIFPEFAHWLESSQSIQIGNKPGIDFAGQMIVLFPIFVLALLLYVFIKQKAENTRFSANLVLIIFAAYLAIYWIGILCDYFGIEFDFLLKIVSASACILITYFLWDRFHLKIKNVSAFKVTVFFSIILIQSLFIFITLYLPAYSINETGDKIQQIIDGKPMVTCYSSFFVATHNKVFYGFPQQPNDFNESDQYFILTNFKHESAFSHDPRKLYFPRVENIPDLAKNIDIFQVAPYGHPKKFRWTFYLWRVN